MKPQVCGSIVLCTLVHIYKCISKCDRSETEEWDNVTHWYHYNLKLVNLVWHCFVHCFIQFIHWIFCEMLIFYTYSVSPFLFYHFLTTNFYKRITSIEKREKRRRRRNNYTHFLLHFFSLALRVHITKSDTTFPSNNWICV